jgi:hypothetical protein
MLEDVGNVAAFVASDKARTITASAINITCGAIITSARRRHFGSPGADGGWGDGRHGRSRSHDTSGSGS